MNFTFRILTNILLITVFCYQSGVSQFHQEPSSSFFKVIEFDSLAIENINPSNAKELYYVQDSLKNKLKSLARIHLKTSGKRHHRLDNQFELITEMALPLGLNSIKVDSAKVTGIVCEYWVSLYQMNDDQIEQNESIVGDNLICVFGKFDDKNKKGKSFKINGRKIELMPYEFIKRNIPIGKRGSVNINNQRFELLGQNKGGEAFFDTFKNSFFGSSGGSNQSLNFQKGGFFISIPINGNSNNNALQTNRNFAYFLYNIYNEKVVIAKTREALIAAKKKEWREKKAAEEAKKKAKEKHKKKH